MIKTAIQIFSMSSH